MVPADRPTCSRRECFRLGSYDRPTRRAQRGEANLGSGLPTDRPTRLAARPSVPTRVSRPTDSGSGRAPPGGGSGEGSLSLSKLVLGTAGRLWPGWTSRSCPASSSSSMAPLREQLYVCIASAQFALRGKSDFATLNTKILGRNISRPTDLPGRGPRRAPRLG